MRPINTSSTEGEKVPEEKPAIGSRNHVPGRWGPTVRRRLRAALVAAAATAGLALSAAPAQAQEEFGIESFSAESSTTQAGAHPDLRTTVEFNTIDDLDDDPDVDALPGGPTAGQVLDLIVDIPAGVSGDPKAVPYCEQADYLEQACPASTQVGVLVINALAFGPFPFPTPVYNLAPRNENEVARLGVNLFETYIFLRPRSEGDLGIEASTLSINAIAGIWKLDLTLWGVPADHNGADIPRKPFLTNPTRCGEIEPPTARANSYGKPGEFVSAVADPAPTTVDGCELVPFDPSASLQPQSQAADSPSAYATTIEVPQNEDPDGIAASHLRDVEVTFPEGVSINPPAADGQVGCTDEELGIGTRDPASCPNASKIGRVEIDSPALSVPLRGGVYLREPTDDELFRLAIAASGQGVHLKSVGIARPDEDTGQITATFHDLPQQPAERIHLELFGGPRAPLANPPVCGTYETEVSLTSWSGKTVDLTDSFDITESPTGGPCPETLADRQFEPTMKAGVVNPVAGSFTPFVFRLKRPDGHQEILATEVTPPEGVTARLAAVPFCEDADAQAGTCGPESKVGTAITGAGAGPSPFYIQSGEVHLAGPYDPDGPGGDTPEAPLSLVISVPAIAGPFDLGTVNVRAAVYVDPTTAQLRVVSDPIPQILEGIPLRVRDIRIRMDRDRFTIAPTDCTETEVTGKATGSHGGEADLQNRFQVGECASLGFKPKLTFSAQGGKKATKRNAHPGLKANLVVPGADAYAEGAERGSQANIKRVQVTLPKGLFLDQASPALTDPCTREEYAEGNCPASSRVGTAVAHTPLLDEPLRGPVYLRTGDNKLPDLVADLDGLVDIDLVGAVSQAKQRIRNTFRIVPDVPVSSFELKIQGGAKGLLVNSNVGKGLCGKKRRQINVAMRAHNDRTHAYKTQMKAPCGKAKAKRLRRQAKQLRRQAKAARRAGRAAQAKRLGRRAERLARRAARR
jgi:hypothetical protein